MSLKISTHKGHRITSQMLNDRVTDVVGGNALLSGFEVIKASNTMLEITPGKCIIDGAIIEETSSNPCQIGFHSSWGAYSSMFVIMRYTHNECNAEILIRCKEDMIDRDLVLAEVFCTSTQIEKVIQTPYVKNLKEINEIAVKVEGVGATPVSNEVSGKVVKADNTFAGNIENLNIKGQSYHNLVRGENIEEAATMEMQSEEDYNLTVEDSVAGAVDVAVKGRTIQNLVASQPANKSFAETHRVEFVKLISGLKANVEYTVIIEYSNYSPISNSAYSWYDTLKYPDGTNEQYPHKINANGINRRVIIPTKDTTPQYMINAGMENYANGNMPSVDVESIMILEGNWLDIPIDKIPFVEGIESVGERESNIVNVKSCGKNIFDNNSEFKNTIIKQNGKYVLPSNTFIKWIDLANPVKLKKGATYSLSIPGFSGSGARLGASYSEGAYVAASNPDNIDIAITTSITFTAKEEYIYLGICTDGTYASNGKPEVQFNIQIEEGSIVTPYEAYKESIQTYQLDEPLRSLPDGACDEITSQGKLIRRVGFATVDGSENWWPDGTAEGSTEETLRFGMNWPHKAGISKCLSNNFKYLKDSFMFIRDEESCCVKEGGVSIRIKKSKLETADVAGFKAWLQANQTTIYFELAEPITTQLNKPTLDTYDGVTHIDSANYLAPTLKIDSVGLSKDVPLLKPNTKYTVKFTNTEKRSILGIDLGGSKTNTNADEASIITPQSLVHNKIYVSSNNNSKIKDIMVIEGNSDNHEYICGIEGVGDKSGNLFDLTKSIVQDYYIGDEGIAISSTGTFYQDVLLPVKRNTNYVFRKVSTGARRVALYDNNMVFMKRFVSTSYSNDFVFNTENATYIKVSADLRNLHEIQLEEGTVATSYKAYYDGCKIKVLSHGKNLFNFKEHCGYACTYSKGFPYESGITIESLGSDRYRLLPNGFYYRTSDDTNNTGLGFYIKCKKNTVYTFSCDVSFIGSYAIKCQGIYKHEKPVKTRIPDDRRYVINTDVRTDSNISKTFNSQNYDYLFFYLGGAWQSEMTTAKEMMFTNIQLEEGSSITEYENYKSSEIEIMLDEPLMSLPNGVCDEIVGNKVIRRVGKGTLDGEEGWYSYNSLNAVLRCGSGKFRGSLKRQNGVLANLVCDKFPAIANSNIDTENICHNGNPDIILSIDKSKLETADINGFRLWLSQNPVTVYYELEEPIIEELPVQRPLQSFDEATYVSATTNILPMLSLTLPNLAKAINQNSGRLSELEDIIDNIIIPGLIDTDYRNMLFGFDYSMDRLLLK